MKIWILAEMNVECREDGTARWSCPIAAVFSDRVKLRTDFRRFQLRFYETGNLLQISVRTQVLSWEPV